LMAVICIVESVSAEWTDSINPEYPVGGVSTRNRQASTPIRAERADSRNLCAKMAREQTSPKEGETASHKMECIGFLIKNRRGKWMIRKTISREKEVKHTFS